MSVDFRVYTLYEGLIWGFLNNSVKTLDTKTPITHSYMREDFFPLCEEFLGKTTYTVYAISLMTKEQTCQTQHIIGIVSILASKL